MATLVFGVLGNAIYPGVGGVVGALVGGAIDTYASMKISQALTPRNNTFPEKYKNPSADNGNPAHVCFGKHVRVPGQVIYMSRIKEVSLSGEEKGKTPGSVTYKYVSTIAVAFARSYVQDYLALLANGDNFWAQSDVLVEPVYQEITQIVAHIHENSDGTSWHVLSFIIEKPLPRMSSVGIYSRGMYSLEGPIPENVRVARLAGNYLKPPGWVQFDFETNYLYNFVLGDVGVVAPGITVAFPTMWKMTDVEPEIATDSQYIESSPEFYSGLANQPVSPIILDILDGQGVDPDMIPAFRGTSYVVLPDFNVTKFGGSLPRFEAVLRPDSVLPYPTLGQIVRKICEKAVRSVGVFVDTSEVEDVEVSGFAIAGAVPVIDSLKQLMEFYFLDCVETWTLDESSGTITPVLKFVKREDVGARAVPYTDGGASEEGVASYVRQEVVVADRRDLPTSLTLDYIDAENAFLPGSYTYTNKAGNVNSESSNKLSTDLVLTRNRAEFTCKRALWNAQSLHDQIKLTLPPSYVDVQPGDHLSWYMANQDPDTVRVRINRVARGDNGLVAIEGFIDDTLSYAQTSVAVYSSPPNSFASFRNYGFTSLYLLDLPPLEEAHVSRFGLYVFNAMTVSNGNIVEEEGTSPAISDTIVPTNVFKSIDGEVYTQVSSQTTQGVFGYAETVLGAGSDVAWDTHNTVEIFLAERNMSLSSASEEAVANGNRNNAVIGGEVLGFCQVELLASGNYRLSHLLRGRRDTILAAASHGQNELFVLLGPSNRLEFIDLQNADYRRTLQLLGVPSGAPFELYTPENLRTIVPQAETLQPFRPRSCWLRRSSDQTIRFYFKWRSRVPYRLGCCAPLPRTGDLEHRFALEIFWTAPEALDGYELVRRIECCFDKDDEYWMEYTREDQIRDFHHTGRILDGSFPADLSFEVYKVSSTLATGRRSVRAISTLGPEVVFF